MKKTLFLIFGAVAVASPVAPRGCETVNVGVSYTGNRGESASITRNVTNGQGHWNVLVGVDEKDVKTPYWQ